MERNQFPPGSHLDQIDRICTPALLLPLGASVTVPFDYDTVRKTMHKHAPRQMGSTFVYADNQDGTTTITKEPHKRGRPAIANSTPSRILHLAPGESVAFPGVTLNAVQVAIHRVREKTGNTFTVTTDATGAPLVRRDELPRVKGAQHEHLPRQPREPRPPEPLYGLQPGQTTNIDASKDPGIINRLRTKAAYHKAHHAMTYRIAVQGPQVTVTRIA